MGSRKSLCDWTRHFLPGAARCAREAARALLLALQERYTAVLAELGRQARPQTPAKGARQYLDRWLDHPDWDAPTLYAALLRFAAPFLEHGGDVLILVDLTDLGERWSVLEFAICWQGRALPIYRDVVHRTAPEEEREARLRTALAFLQRHLPVPVSRCVVVMDRGFPGHWLVKALQKGDWRFVLRVTRRWKVEHADYTGELGAAALVPDLVGPTPRLLERALLGRRGKGAREWSVAHVVLYHGSGQPAPWYLVTSEREARAAVAIYARRPQIDSEFRDVKGDRGLDRLAHWQSREQVACFLGMVALYEWRLAWLWWSEQLHQQARFFTVHGTLSWIRVTREWLQREQRLECIQRQQRLVSQSAIDGF